LFYSVDVSNPACGIVTSTASEGDESTEAFLVLTR